MRCGQVVVGPAGSGKTTYCKVMKEILRIKKRNCYVINLDSASEEYYYERKKKSFSTTSSIEKELGDHYNTIYDLDIRDVIDVNSLIDEEKIGPNCALMRSIEVFYENSHIFEDELNSYDSDDSYFLIDTPGQTELYTHTDYFKKVLEIFQMCNIQLVIVFLIDVSFISSNTKLLAAYFTSLSTMINFELPHINLLTKCDLLSSKNYHEEFKKSKMQQNFFFQNKLYKKLSKKVREYNRIRKKEMQELTDMEDASNGDVSDYNNNDMGKKSFKEEFLSFSDVEAQSVSSRSSSCASVSNKSNQFIYEDEEESSEDDLDEERIYAKNYESLNDLLTLDPSDILMRANKCMSKKYFNLNAAFVNILESFNMVSFTPLNIYDDESVEFVINAIDMVTQYGEDRDVNDSFDM